MSGVWANRVLLRNVSFYAASDFLLFGLNYLIQLPILTRHLAPAEYGIVATTTAVMLLLTALLQLGMPSAALRYYFHYDTPALRRAYFASVTTFTALIACGLAAGATLVGSRVWPLVIRDLPFETFGVAVVWTAVFQVLIVFKSALLRAQERVRLYVLLEFAQFAVQLILVVWYVAWLNAGALGQVRGVLHASALFAGVSVLVLWSNLSGPLQLRFVWESIGFALATMAGAIVSFAATRLNLLLMQQMATRDAIGLFAIGTQLGRLVEMAFASVTKAWLPMFYAAEPDRARKMIRSMARTAVPLLFACAAGIGLFAPEIIALLTAPPYVAAWAIAGVMATASAVGATATLAGAGLSHARRTGVWTWVLAGTATVEVCGNLLAVPRLGAMGAALASAASASTLLVLASLAERRIFHAAIRLLPCFLIAGLIPMLLVIAAAIVRPDGVLTVASMTTKLTLLVGYVGVAWLITRPLLGPATGALATRPGSARPAEHA